jgi:hypothetical protein
MSLILSSNLIPAVVILVHSSSADMWDPHVRKHESYIYISEQNTCKQSHTCHKNIWGFLQKIQLSHVSF